LLLVSRTIAPSVRAADDPSLAPLLARAGNYVRGFEHDFALVVSDEDYRQRVSGRLYPSSRNRRTRAEMLFMWIPEQAGWLTVRNVLSVDGRDVPDSQARLNEALDDTTTARVTRLRRLLNDNARFNLGQILRNFNYPTLALSYLDPEMQPRFAYTLAGHERVNGVAVSKVEFDERTRPTVIQENGADRFSQGAVWIADRDGAIVRTRLDLRIPLKETIASIEVDYARDPKLDMWVPVRMHESYLQSRATMINESIDCVATYSNFRRFETSGRIVTPKF
jgi:hypothetical protein